MQAVIVPKFDHFVSLFTSKVLEDRNTASLREGEKFALILGVNRAKNKGMIDRIDVAVQEGSAHGIGSSTNDKIASHHISLKACSLQTRYVLSNRDKYLSAEMTTLLDTRLLIFNVNTASAGINKHFNEFHN